MNYPDILKRGIEAETNLGTRKTAESVAIIRRGEANSRIAAAGGEPT
jgi:hypothetical protein